MALIKHPKPANLREMIEQVNRDTRRQRRRAFALGLLLAPLLAGLLAALLSAASLLNAATSPIPDLSAQTCTVRADGQRLSVTCDSSAVCPPGYHLFTRILDPAAAGSIEVLFGYGSDQERENTCMLNSAQAPGLTRDGKKIDSFQVGGAH